MVKVVQIINNKGNMTDNHTNTRTQLHKHSLDTVYIDIHKLYILFLIITRNELASLAHSFYTCLKHQLMLPSIIVLLSSTLDYVACMMLDPQLYNIITF